MFYLKHFSNLRESFILKTMKKLIHLTSWIVIFTYTKREAFCFTISTVKKSNKNMRDGRYCVNWRKKERAAVRANLLICSVLFFKRVSFKFIFEISFSNTILIGSYSWRKRGKCPSADYQMFEFVLHIILLCGEQHCSVVDIMLFSKDKEKVGWRSVSHVSEYLISILI